MYFVVTNVSVQLPVNNIDFLSQSIMLSAHLRTQIVKSSIDVLKSLVDVLESLVNVLKLSVNVLESMCVPKSSNRVQCACQSHQIDVQCACQSRQIAG